MSQRVVCLHWEAALQFRPFIFYVFLWSDATGYVAIVSFSSGLVGILRYVVVLCRIVLQMLLLTVQTRCRTASSAFSDFQVLNTVSMVLKVSGY